KTEGQRDRDFGGTEVLNKDGRSVASNSDSTRESIPHANKDVSGSIMVGSTLRFSTQKNILEVILAACEACALEPRLRFVFIGEGEHFQLCKAIVSSKGLNERILLPGWDSDVSIWLSQMDVFMLYSRWEALPFSIIEANFSGLPVIGSSIPSIKELVNEEVGWLVPLDDRPALVRTLTSLPHQAGAISQKGHLARQGIGQLCDYQSMVDAYLKLYRSK
ncbi:MAG TPA: glycosyltransferase, partial [Candidatus Cloacimonadota bacterium]|nr:glycosyltransferase [Candidatus Cloacimonadota bacterium]